MSLDKQVSENTNFIEDSNSDLTKVLRPQEYMLDLEAKISELKDLCQNLDPYSPLSEITKSKLIKYGVEELDNPFAITNKLLLLLEDSISEQLKLRLKN
jgi:hypothetical protein